MATLNVNESLNLADSLGEVACTEDRVIYNATSFRRMIAVERKRTERSKEPFLLLLLELGNNKSVGKTKRALETFVSALSESMRETDVLGWYKDKTVAGVMFTGLTMDNRGSFLSAIMARISTALRRKLSSEQFNQISFSFHFFPDDWDHHDAPGGPSDRTLYPDLPSRKKNARLMLAMKRGIDILGSSTLLVLCAPLFAAAAAAIKVSSKGPILFKQQRVGQFGCCFTFLKFRSMEVNNDAREHREYMEKLIAGQPVRVYSDKGGDGVYKLTNDARITKVGKILRKTSLDELPQLINVLVGDMSLVGPRPPIPYEVGAYQTWHRRRVLQAKPGMTGLWQVMGRSRTRFDDMVRLDLRYATSWSLWLDLKILLRTPAAVLKGAY